MKTNNQTKALLLGAAILLALPMAAANAQTALPGTSTTATEASSNAPVVPAPAVKPATVPTELPTAMSADAIMSKMDSSKTDPAVTAVVDRLKQDSTPMSISDMSAAQDALARLNLLSEIEQKLSQIDEIRNKRQLGALGAMPGMSSTDVFNYAATGRGGLRGMNMGSSGTEVVAITGAGGKYTATLSLDGRQIIVKNGSKLPDGGVVRSISSSGVTVKKSGKTSTLPFVQVQTANSTGTTNLPVPPTTN